MRKSIRRALCAENLTGIGLSTTEIFPVRVASRRKIIITRHVLVAEQRVGLPSNWPLKIRNLRP